MTLFSHLETGLRGLDRALGGGVPRPITGYMVLLSGPPGVGKTTLLTTMGRALSDRGERVAMVSSELRFLALQYPLGNSMRFAFLHETRLDVILRRVQFAPGSIVFVDSVEMIDGRMDKKGRPLKSANACAVTFSKALREVVQKSGVTVIVVMHRRERVSKSLSSLYDLTLDLRFRPISEGSKRELRVSGSGRRETHALFVRAVDEKGRRYFEDVTFKRRAKQEEKL